MNRTATLILILLSFGALHAQVEQPRPGRYEKVSLRPQPAFDVDALASMLVERQAEKLGSGWGLQVRSQRQSPGGHHISFAQTVDGWMVFSGEIHATLTQDWRVMALIDGLLPFQSKGEFLPWDSASVARSLFANTLDATTEEIFALQPVWHHKERHLSPAVYVRHAHSNTVYEAVLSQDLTDTLYWRNLEVFHHHPTELDTPGTGLVFNPDPLTSSGNAYGGNFSDNSDQDNADLNGERVSVALRDLIYFTPNFILSGPYVTIMDFESPNILPATTLDGNFNFLRSESGFEDVMVYYHIDTFQRYVQSLGFTNLGNASIPADPHGLFGGDNSHFVANGQFGKVAFGEGGVDDAEDADVIIHEYGHALSHSALNGGNSGNERNGLDEGLGDYFAASYSRGLSYQFWKNTFTWDGHNEFWDGRSASTPMMYPPSTPNLYLYGEIWATALMEVYHVIGKTKSDRIVLQSMYSNAGNISLNDAAHIILDADSLLYGGAHADEYQRAFCDRGIFNGQQVGGECFVGMGDKKLDEIGFSFYPNPASHALDLNLESYTPDARYEVVDLLGVVRLSGKIQGLTAHISLGDLAAGSYLIQVSGGKKRPSSQLFVVAH